MAWVCTGFHFQPLRYRWQCLIQEVPYFYFHLLFLGSDADIPNKQKSQWNVSPLSRIKSKSRLNVDHVMIQLQIKDVELATHLGRLTYLTHSSMNSLNCILCACGWMLTHTFPPKFNTSICQLIKANHI